MGTTTPLRTSNDNNGHVCRTWDIPLWIEVEYGIVIPLCDLLGVDLGQHTRGQIQIRDGTGLIRHIGCRIKEGYRSRQYWNMNKGFGTSRSSGNLSIQIICQWDISTPKECGIIFIIRCVIQKRIRKFHHPIRTTNPTIGRMKWYNRLFP